MKIMKIMRSSKLSGRNRALLVTLALSAAFFYSFKRIFSFVFLTLQLHLVSMLVAAAGFLGSLGRLPPVVCEVYITCAPCAGNVSLFLVVFTLRSKKCQRLTEV
jgi:hypothetical protein